jgi:lipopolysaccharide export LptBFGC system permease protein LptF
MKNSASQLFFLLLITTFSIIWISDELAVVIENERYDFYEMAENSDKENQTENKLKTQFLDEIELLNLSRSFVSSSQKNNSSYLFKIKEASSENLTPPPETI